MVSPDAGRVRLADMWTDRLNSSLAIIHKRRDPDVANTVAIHEVVGEVEDRVCLLVDDMIDTAGTICQAAEALKVARCTGGDRGRDPSGLVRTGHGPTQGRRLRGGDRHQHSADPRRTSVRLSDRAVDRTPDRPGHPRGIRRRLRDQPLQRPSVAI